MRELRACHPPAGLVGRGQRVHVGTRTIPRSAASHFRNGRGLSALSPGSRPATVPDFLVSREQAVTFRTILLVVCMICVPAIALFSHRLPAEIRVTVREAVVAGISRCRAAVTTKVTPVARISAAVDSAAAAASDKSSPGVALAVAADLAPKAANTAERLAMLGVTQYECRHLTESSGDHLATCHVPLDAAGQLTRVFQATGPDGEAAVAALLSEVEKWQRREVEPERGGTAAGSRILR